MNSSPITHLNSPHTIQLTIAQLESIFEQLGLSGAQFSPHARAVIKLESYQLPSNAIAIPITNFNASIPTVQSILSSSIVY